ncbi:5324_t:CDS:2 [Funneliformis mosseae]|uniref:5324_t:CDS:1 n=1 Tax=Funneliformis mosseae TaxID=27381 RepID=A0A9N8YZF1_FUNMO|nr:5324_t:CDS:2 [Funneliformis mosseae]
MNYTTDEKLSLHHHKNRENHEFDLVISIKVQKKPIDSINLLRGCVKVLCDGLFPCGIKITKETLDIIVASKDGRHLQELETSVTIIENVTPNTNKQPHQHNHESIMNRIREGVFKNRNSCAYFALTILLLSAIIIGGVIFYFRDVSKTTVEEPSTYDEKNVTEDNTTTEEDHNLTQVSFNNAHFGPTSTLEPPLYSSNTNHELISAASLNPLTVNIQQSVDENKL